VWRLASCSWWRQCGPTSVLHWFSSNLAGKGQWPNLLQSICAPAHNFFCIMPYVNTSERVLEVYSKNICPKVVLSFLCWEGLSSSIVLARWLSQHSKLNSSAIDWNTGAMHTPKTACSIWLVVQSLIVYKYMNICLHSCNTASKTDNCSKFNGLKPNLNALHLYRSSTVWASHLHNCVLPVLETQICRCVLHRHVLWCMLYALGYGSTSAFPKSSLLHHLLF
jgi:hypothetical protein